MNKIAVEKSNSCLKNNDDFLCLKEKSKLAVVRRIFDSPAIRELIFAPETELSKVETPLKDSRSAKAATIRLNDGTEIFLKRYNNKGLSYTLKYLLRRSRAFRAWKNSWLFELCGVLSPRAVFAMEERKSGMLANAYIATESVPGAIPTIEYFKEISASPDLSENFARTISGLLAPLHENGISHGDLKLSNIYAKKDQDDNWKFGLWDLDGATLQKRPLNENERIRDLARLTASYIEIGSRINIEISLEGAMDLFSANYENNANIKTNQENLKQKIIHYLNKDRK
jgi:tRNA A-37 threonylcarbamoyl transferase component Bud32